MLNLISFRLLLPIKNQSVAKTFNVLGKVMLSILVQPVNNQFGASSTPSGTTTLLIALQLSCLNASNEIDLTLYPSISAGIITFSLLPLYLVIVATPSSTVYSYSFVVSAFTPTIAVPTSKIATRINAHIFFVMPLNFIINTSFTYV